MRLSTLNGLVCFVAVAAVGACSSSSNSGGSGGAAGSGGSIVDSGTGGTGGGTGGTGGGTGGVGGGTGGTGGGTGGVGGGTGGTGGSTSTGVCRKFCCSVSDCGSGESCVAFDAALGTLGACIPGGGTGGAAGAAGAPADGGTGDAAPPAEGGTGLPPGCWTGPTTPACNPLTNDGCNAAGGEACDFGTDSNQQPGLLCFGPPNTLPVGSPCDNANGPEWCLPGNHCTPTQ